MCFLFDRVCKPLLVNLQCYLIQSSLGWLCWAGPSPSHSPSCTAADLLSEQTGLLCTAGAHRHSSRSSWGGKHSLKLASQTLWVLSSLGSCCTWWQTTWGYTRDRGNVECRVFNNHIVDWTLMPWFGQAPPQMFKLCPLPVISAQLFADIFNCFLQKYSWKKQI